MLLTHAELLDKKRAGRVRSGCSRDWPALRETGPLAAGGVNRAGLSLEFDRELHVCCGWLPV